MAKPSFSISIGVDSGQVKSNLDQVRQQFQQASQGINAALGNIQGFVQLKRQTAETGAALNEARQRVADLARLVKSGSGGTELAAQFEQARVQASRLKEQLAGQESRLQGLRSQLQSAGIATGNLAAAQATARRALDQTRETYQHLADVAGARDVLGVRAHVELQGEINRTNQALALLKKTKENGQITSQEFAQAQHKAAERIRELSVQTNGAAKRLRDLAGSWRGLAAAVGAAGVGAAIKSMVDTYAGFDDQMRRVAALSGATGQQFDQLTAKAQELGAKTRYSAAQAAGGMAQLAAAGQSTEQIVATIGPALNMAAAGGSNLETAADQLTNIMGAFQLKAEQSGHVADVLTQGFTGAATTLDQLAGAMLYAGPVASSLGYSIEETTALLQALADAGYKGEKAGTALRGGLSRLLNPTKEVSDTLAKYNLSLTDSAGRMRPLKDILGELAQKQEHIKGSSEAAADVLKIFGQEAGPALQTLMAKGRDALEGYEKALAHVDGKAQQTADDMEKGLGGAMRRWNAAVEAVQTSFGTAFEPVTKGLYEMGASVAGWIASLSSSTKVTMGVVTGLGLLGAGIYSVVKAIRGISAASRALRDAIRLAELQTGKLNAELLRTGTAASTGTNRAIHAYGNLDRALEKTRAQAKATSAGLGRIASGAGAAAGKLAGLFDVGMAFSAGWFIGDMLNQFDIVRKAGASLVYGLDRVRLGAIRMWRALTGGDTGEIDREIAAAKQAYQSLLDDIEKGQDDWSKKQRGEVPELQKHDAGTEPPPPPLPPPETDSEPDDEAEARIARREELEQELADKREAREQAAFDARMARQEKLDAAAAEREQAAAERQNALEEQKDARANAAAERAGELERQQEQLAADTLENRLIRLQLEEDAARAAHEDKMAQLAAEAEALEATHRDKLARLAEEAEARKSAYAQTRQDIQAELDDLKVAHEAKMEMIRQELAAAEQSGDARAQRAARKKMDSEQAGYDRDSGKLVRQARKAEQEEAGAVQDDARKTAAENARADREQAAVERRKRQEEAAETRRQKAAEAKKATVTAQAEAAERGKAEVEAEARSKEQSEAKAEKKRRRKGRARQEEQEHSESAARSATSITAAQMQEEQKAEQGLQEIRETGAQEQQARLRDAAAAEKQAAEERLRAEEAATAKKKSLFEDYANRVRSLSEDMAKRSKDLQEDLIDLDPYASEEAKWQKRAELARDYEEQAKAAMQAGNLQDALKLSDQAAAAYKNLKGAPEGVNEKLAANTAYQGVQAAGALAKSIEKLMAEQLKKQATVDLGPAGAAVSQAAGKLGGSGQREEPAKVVELKLGNARLSGSQQDVDDFIAQLERAGMTA